MFLRSLEIIVSDSPEDFHSGFFQPLQALVSQSRSSKVMARYENVCLKKYLRFKCGN